MSRYRVFNLSSYRDVGFLFASKPTLSFRDHEQMRFANTIRQKSAQPPDIIDLGLGRSPRFWLSEISNADVEIPRGRVTEMYRSVMILKIWGLSKLRFFVLADMSSYWDVEIPSYRALEISRSQAIHTRWVLFANRRFSFYEFLSIKF